MTIQQGTQPPSDQQGLVSERQNLNQQTLTQDRNLQAPTTAKSIYGRGERIRNPQAGAEADSPPLGPSP